MRPTGVWVLSLIDLDTALAVDEQRAVRAQVVQHYAFEVIHAYARFSCARVFSDTVARQFLSKSMRAILCYRGWYSTTKCHEEVAAAR